MGGLQIPRWLGSDPLSAWWLGLAPATLEFWVRFPNERNQGKQAHPVLKYRVPHGSQCRCSRMRVRLPLHILHTQVSVCVCVCVLASSHAHTKLPCMHAGCLTVRSAPPLSSLSIPLLLYTHTHTCIRTHHTVSDERTPIEATPLSATSAELGLGLGLGLGLVHTPPHTLLSFSPPSFHTISLSLAFTSA